MTTALLEKGTKTELVIAKKASEFVRLLWESGYLVERRSLWDIQNKADEMTYTFDKQSLTKALTESNFIVKTGKLSHGVPLYKQRFPPTGKRIDRNNSGLVLLFESLDLHPEIKRVSKALFEDGHYPQAIFDAFKQLNIIVKRKSGMDNLDGKKLMLDVFSVNSPILKLNQLKSVSDKDEQEGFMHLFAGAIQGIRNPKGHEEITQGNGLKTIEYLCLASLLAKTVDSSSK